MNSFCGHPTAFAAAGSAVGQVQVLRAANLWIEVPVGFHRIPPSRKEAGRFCGGYPAVAGHYKRQHGEQGHKAEHLCVWGYFSLLCFSSRGNLSALPENGSSAASRGCARLVRCLSSSTLTRHTLWSMLARELIPLWSRCRSYTPHATTKPSFRQICPFEVGSASPAWR